MYLHLGENTVVRTDSIIGIFDMDTSTISKTIYPMQQRIKE